MDNEEIISLLRRQYPQDLIVLTIRYGNFAGRDIDLLAVVDDRFQTPNYELAATGLDVCFLPLSEFLCRLDYACPAITEAVLTGELILGDKRVFFRLKDELLQKIISPADCQKIHREATAQLKTAGSWLKNEKTDPARGVLLALCDLSFALSFELFARHYQRQNQGVITLAELRQEKNGLLEKTIAAFKQAKHGLPPAPGQTERLLAKIQGVLEGND